MPHYVIFIVLFTGSMLYAFWKGGGPERWAAGILLVGVVLTGVAEHFETARFSTIQWGVAAADCFVLAGFTVIALRSTRYWPMWLAALQIIQLSSDFTRTLPGMIDLVYAIASSLIGYPLCIIIAMGTARHRLRTARYGAQQAWRARTR